MLCGCIALRSTVGLRIYLLLLLSWRSNHEMGGKQDVVCGGQVEIPYKLTYGIYVQ